MATPVSGLPPWLIATTKFDRVSTPSPRQPAIEQAFAEPETAKTAIARVTTVKGRFIERHPHTRGDIIPFSLQRPALRPRVQLANRAQSEPKCLPHRPRHTPGRPWSRNRHRICLGN